MNPIREALNNLPGHWFQGGGKDKNGNKCGLIHVSSVSSPTETVRAGYVMAEVVQEQYPERISYLGSGITAFFDFNDHEDTTEAEVVAVMEKAAIKWDETHGI